MTLPEAAVKSHGVGWRDQGPAVDIGRKNAAGDSQRRLCFFKGGTFGVFPDGHNAVLAGGFGMVAFGCGDDLAVTGGEPEAVLPCPVPVQL